MFCHQSIDPSTQARQLLLHSRHCTEGQVPSPKSPLLGAAHPLRCLSVSRLASVRVSFVGPSVAVGWDQKTFTGPDTSGNRL